MAEWIAQTTLASFLDADVVQADVAGTEGLYDFDIAMRDGTTMALEVTSDVIGEGPAFEAAVRRRAAPAQCDGLTRHWEVRVPTTINVGVSLDEIKRAVIALDATGVTGFADPFSSTEPYYWEGAPQECGADRLSVGEILVRAGIRTAWAFGRADEGRAGDIYLVRESTGGRPPRPREITTAVEAAASRKQNVLSAAKAMKNDERWLFLWLHSDHGTGLDYAHWWWPAHQVPPPSLPPEIDRALLASWSATPGEGIGHVLVWLAASEGRWVNLAESPSPGIRAAGLGYFL